MKPLYGFVSSVYIYFHMAHQAILHYDMEMYTFLHVYNFELRHTLFWLQIVLLFSWTSKYWLITTYYMKKILCV